MGNRYAELRYGYNPHGEDGEVSCNDWDASSASNSTNTTQLPPIACRQGGNDAQSMAANTAFVKNVCVLVFSSSVGRYSDCYGRKVVLTLGYVLMALTPLTVWLIQVVPTTPTPPSSSAARFVATVLNGLTNPIWFYLSSASHGLISVFTICITILSDIMLPEYRAPAYGIFLSTYYIGFSVAQLLPKVFAPITVSMISFLVLLLGSFFSAMALPETVSKDSQQRAIRRNEQQYNSTNTNATATAGGGNTTTFTAECGRYIRIVLRPILELRIVFRNRFFRLVALISVCSGMIYSSDTTLIIYYMKNQFNIGYQSISTMLLCSNLVGVLVQACLLKMMINRCGEKYTLIVGLLVGGLHNVVYGMATKPLLFGLGLIVSNFAAIHFPILISIRSINVGRDEQGHIQGAFFALAAIADAIGPVLLQAIYKVTTQQDDTTISHQSRAFGGPGTMFMVAAGVYVFGACMACLLPSNKTNAAEACAAVASSPVALASSSSSSIGVVSQQRYHHDTTSREYNDDRDTIPGDEDSVITNGISLEEPRRLLGNNNNNITTNDNHDDP